MDTIQARLGEKKPVTKDEISGLIDLLGHRARRKTCDELRDHFKKPAFKWPNHPVFEFIVLEENEAFLVSNSYYQNIKDARQAVLKAFRGNNFRGVYG